MNKSWVTAGGIVAIALVVTVQMGPDGSVFSPGPVASVHQRNHDQSDITCGNCHDGDGVRDNAQCLSCHEDQKRTPDKHYRDSLCIDCHKEHRGSDVALTAVADEQCYGCHKEGETHVTAPVQMAFGRDEDPRDCLSCHDNHHLRHRQANVAQLSMAELRADLVNTHRPNPDKMLFHRSTCTWCHKEQSTFSPQSAATRQGFSDPHVTHVGNLKIGCTWCHTKVDIGGGGGLGPSLRRSVDTGTCVQCHAADYYGLSPEAGRDLVKPELKARGGR